MSAESLGDERTHRVWAGEEGTGSPGPGDLCEDRFSSSAQEFTRTSRSLPCDPGKLLLVGWSHDEQNQEKEEQTAASCALIGSCQALAKSLKYGAAATHRGLADESNNKHLRQRNEIGTVQRSKYQPEFRWFLITRTEADKKDRWYSRA